MQPILYLNVMKKKETSPATRKFTGAIFAAEPNKNSEAIAYLEALTNCIKQFCWVRQKILNEVKIKRWDALKGGLNLEPFNWYATRASRKRLQFNQRMQLMSSGAARGAYATPGEPENVNACNL